MGRKSAAKKEIRKLVEEKEKKEVKGLLKKKKSKKELKEEVRKESKGKEPAKKTRKTKKKATKKKESRIKKHKNKIMGGALTLIMIALLISVGVLLFQKAFRPQPVAKILPAEDTVAVFELNTNFQHNQVDKGFSLLSSYPGFSKTGLIGLAEERFLFDFDEEIEPWLGRQAGMVFINSKSIEGKVNLVSFAEVYSLTNIEKHLEENYTKSHYKFQNLYTTDLENSAAIINQYVFFADTPSAIKELIDAQEDDKLFDSDDYRRVEDNLPISRLALAYINFDKFSDDLFSYVPFLSEKGVSAESLKNLLGMFSSEGMVLIALDDKFVMQSFTNLNIEGSRESSLSSGRNKYKADLTSKVNKDALAFWGLESPEYQIKKMIDVYSGGDTIVQKSINGWLDSYTKKYFGKGIGFEDDILPLLRNEVALSIETGEVYKALIQLDSPKKDALKIYELAENFAQAGAVFEPQVVEHELEDGTIAREIMAVPKEVVIDSYPYKEITIYFMELGEERGGIYYGIVDDTVVISTSPEGVKTTIDLAQDDSESLRKSTQYNEMIDPVLQSSDEVTYFNLEELLPILINEEELPLFLKPIGSLSSGHDYFTDGITTVNYLNIK